MVEKNYYFYLSGALSLTLFALVLSLFAYMVLGSKTVKSFALTKENFVKISLEHVPTNTRVKKAAAAAQTKSNVKQKPDPAPDISTLFSKVKTKKITKKKKPKKTDSKRIQDISKRFSKLDAKQSSSISETLKKLELKTALVSAQEMSASTASEVNEYLAKIQGTVYDNFFPPQNSEGNSAKVRIRVSSQGHLMSFKVLVYGRNEYFNEEIDALHQRLMNTAFPENPDGKDVTIQITLTATKE